MRVAAIDIGTNTTRLLIGDAGDGRIEVERRESRVTGLGRGVETSGQLATDAIGAVYDAIGDYVAAARDAGVERTAAIATSAVRDAANGAAFLAELRERFSLTARVLDGGEEALLTYRGATSEPRQPGQVAVLDIGGGSTELIVGDGPEPAFHASLQVGVIRHSERHLHADPPATAELEALAEDVGSALEAELSQHPGLEPGHAIAVAGTPAMLAAMELGAEPFDARRVEGHVLQLGTIQQACSRLSALPLAERRGVPGIDPARAATIVAGVVILIKAMRALGLSEVEVSEHDILYGAALEAADGVAGRA